MTYGRINLKTISVNLGPGFLEVFFNMARPRTGQRRKDKRKGRKAKEGAGTKRGVRCTGTSPALATISQNSAMVVGRLYKNYLGAYRTLPVCGPLLSGLDRLQR